MALSWWSFDHHASRRISRVGLFDWYRIDVWRGHRDLKRVVIVDASCFYDTINERWMLASDPGSFSLVSSSILTCHCSQWTWTYYWCEIPFFFLYMPLSYHRDCRRCLRSSRAHSRFLERFQCRINFYQVLGCENRGKAHGLCTDMHKLRKANAIRYERSNRPACTHETTCAHRRRMCVSVDMCRARTCAPKRCCCCNVAMLQPEEHKFRPDIVSILC